MIALKPVIFATVSLLLSHSAMAVIVEGQFWGKTHEMYAVNMESSPDADFWASDRPIYFKGTFWYDTELVSSSAITHEWGSDYATYDGPTNWLHTSLIIDDNHLDLTSGGKAENYSANPRQVVQLTEFNDPEFQQSMLLWYSDYESNVFRREGWVSFFSRTTSIFDWPNLIQDAKSETWGYDDVLGYLQFEEMDCRSFQCAHSAFFFGEINHFEMHVKAAEPSPLLLLLGPAIMLWMRRRSTSAE